MDEREFTKTWWKNLCADEDRLIKWLQKLQHTERHGFYDNHDAIERFTDPMKDKNAIKVLTQTAIDEWRHADLLVGLIHNRGLAITAPVKSLYWDEMEKVIVDLDTCMAAFHLAETLAAWRFEIFYEYENTPNDVKQWLETVIPDEQYHGKIFRKLTSEDTIARIKIEQQRVIELMKSKK